MATKYAKNIETGELFRSATDREWHMVFAAWKKDTTKPCPMPAGHWMFTGKSTVYKLIDAPGE